MGTVAHNTLRGALMVVGCIGESTLGAARGNLRVRANVLSVSGLPTRHASLRFASEWLATFLLHHGVGAILYLGGAVTTLVSSMYTQTDDVIRTASSLALGASALHLIQATRYLLKHKPGGGSGDATEEITYGFVVETRIARFKSRPPPVPPIPVRIDSSALQALQARRDSSAVAARRESTVVPSRRESSVAYPEYL